MGRALIVLDAPEDRQRAVSWIGKAPAGTRVEFKASKRTLPQNDLLWALLTEVSRQLAHGGRKYDPSEWKAIFLHAFGREISFLPSLDLKTFLPIELSSSDLSKDEMTQFIEFILKEGAERGVVFRQHHENTEPDERSPPGSSDQEAEASPPASASNISARDRELLIEFCRKGLATVSDDQILPGDRWTLIEQMLANYAATVSPQWLDALNSLPRGLKPVLTKDRTADQAIAWFSEVLDCTAEDLTPRRAA